MIIILSKTQTMECYQKNELVSTYPVSTGINGMGEKKDSGCTPRGWHQVYDIIGEGMPINSVFVGRQWTGEIYSPPLASLHPQRDWILTRIIQLDGIEWGRNKGGEVDTLARYIYIHGTPASVPLRQPGSHGCIRMRNEDVVALSAWAQKGMLVYIE